MTSETDPFDLTRFIRAQDTVLARVRTELKEGRKASHWMWFVFPQIAGLGTSTMSRHYAIGSLEEARAYLAHPVLGPRLRECVDILLALPPLSAHEIFGSPDDRKLHSSLTLFAQAAPGETLFTHALERYFGGAADMATVKLLRT
ncbi:uncharacterized protein (DUF1810 family) [Pseudaminobacter salicylatoxidans]|uniref:Uncharacterized protein (DUF1810 family) n=1 Tax=Pseudaminobacter salicylatoxidans TaxID=93369 RepID=A0A316CFV1_PSESE|nr:DUF1810 domain-containing protein [Pseudaminobacter salicylatoxidans]PWJ77619.1 uncharacterized protein (DUF1810 family) [Pseudaminobacter salicylatoxidans]